ncbi:MAG: hypothetical protein HKN23_21700 [Verrucomicrobiales bacterium]|nr:hypothetical protein [Verrucomicrobiales bacterium]
MKFPKRRNQNAGYTLVEALVASAVLMIGIAAAAALSLSLITQEEINERTVRASNYLDNAAQLYRLGFSTTEIKSILPADPIVKDLVFQAKNQNIAGLGIVTLMEMEVEYIPTNAKNLWGNEKWTGGQSGVTRKHKIQVFRGSQHILP